MNRVVFFLIALSLILSAKTVKIATYNVENLFDMHYSGTEYKEYIPGRHNWSEPILQKKLQNIAEVICDMDADVVALQEVESDRVLQRLQGVLSRIGCDYGYRAITDTKPTPIHNAILSKIALKKRRDISIFRRSRHRSILEVDLKTDPPLKLFINHWKSKAGSESERIVYAKALMKRIEKLPAGSEYIILGDLNADYNEYKSIEKRHNDTGGITGINHILKTIKGDKLLRYHDLQEGYHYNLWMELPPYARWSHNFYGDKEALDAIIIPASLADGAGWEYIKDTFGVHKPKYLFGKRGQIRRWEYKGGKHTGRGYSDHLPVYAEFALGSGTKKQKSKESFWDSLVSLFDLSKGGNVEAKPIPKTETKKSIKTEEATVSDIYEIPKLDTPVKLRDIKVIMKMGDSAIIKQKPDGRGILLYRCAVELEEGRRYDIVAYRKKIYKGLDEIVDIEVVKELGSANIDQYLKRFDPVMLSDKKYIGEVVADTGGVYLGRKIEIMGKNYPIYFKRAAKRPKKGTRVMLKRAIIGYYKDHNQLTVWSRDDWSRRE